MCPGWAPRTACSLLRKRSTWAQGWHVSGRATAQSGMSERRGQGVPSPAEPPREYPHPRLSRPPRRWRAQDDPLVGRGGQPLRHRTPRRRRPRLRRMRPAPSPWRLRWQPPRRARRERYVVGPCSGARYQCVAGWVGKASVRALATINEVGTWRSVDRIIPIATEDNIVAFAREDGVPATPPRHEVVATASVDDVVTIESEDAVSAVGAHDDVGAARPYDDVRAARTT